MVDEALTGKRIMSRCCVMNDAQIDEIFSELRSTNLYRLDAEDTPRSLKCLLRASSPGRSLVRIMFWLTIIAVGVSGLVIAAEQSDFRSLFMW